MFSDPTFWVAISFVGFIALAIYLKAPGMVAKALDDRADAIRKELDEIGEEAAVARTPHLNRLAEQGALFTQIKRDSQEPAAGSGNLMGMQLELARSTGAPAVQTSYLAGGIAAIDQFLQWNKVQRWKGVGGDPITMPIQPYEHE